MDAILSWYREGTHLMGLALFLAAVAGAFLAGYLVGRGGRPRAASPPPPATPPAPAEDLEIPPLPPLGEEEARLMDLTAIREAEATPPPPIDPEPPRRR